MMMMVMMMEWICNVHQSMVGILRETGADDEEDDDDDNGDDDDDDDDETGKAIKRGTVAPAKIY